MRLGTKWGIAIGAVWITSLIFMNLVIPHKPWAGIGWLLALAGFALQLVPGIYGAMKTGRVRAGSRAGFWSSLVSGLMVFFILTAIGYVLAFVPGLPGAEFPKINHIYISGEFELVNVSDALGGSLAILFGLCPLFGGIGGTFLGWAGIQLARTGGPPDVFVK